MTGRGGGGDIAFVLFDDAKVYEAVHKVVFEAMMKSFGSHALDDDIVNGLLKNEDVRNKFCKVFDNDEQHDVCAVFTDTSMRPPMIQALVDASGASFQDLVFIFDLLLKITDNVDVLSALRRAYYEEYEEINTKNN